MYASGTYNCPTDNPDPATEDLPIAKIQQVRHGGLGESVGNTKNAVGRVVAIPEPLVLE
jgi:hypothetical protein